LFEQGQKFDVDWHCFAPARLIQVLFDSQNVQAGFSPHSRQVGYKLQSQGWALWQIACPTELQEPPHHSQPATSLQYRQDAYCGQFGQLPQIQSVKQADKLLCVWEGPELVPARQSSSGAQKPQPAAIQLEHVENWEQFCAFFVFCFLRFIFWVKN